MYLSPYDPDGDGAGYTQDDVDNGVYKRHRLRHRNWKPNWDPVFKAGLSLQQILTWTHMTFSMDAVNGCVATMYRGESGRKRLKHRCKHERQVQYEPY